MQAARKVEVTDDGLSLAGHESKQIYTTTELGLAAFLMMRGIEMISCRWTSNHYEVAFKNPNPENLDAGLAAIRQLHNKFRNSEFRILDMNIKELRKTARQRV